MPGQLIGGRLLANLLESVGMAIERSQSLMVMRIYYAKDCLVCHGEPQGDRGISGYPNEEHKEGDLAGAITVTVPLSGK